MKKAILFYSALFLTVAGIAQTHVQSQQTITGATQVQKQPGGATLAGSGSASSATAVQTDAAADAASKSKAEIAAKKQMVATEKEVVQGKVENSVDKVSGNEVSADASANASGNVMAKDNQAGVYAEGDVSSGSAVSLNKVNGAAVEMKNQGETRINNETNATLQKTTEVTSVVHAKAASTTRQTGSATVGAATKVVTAAKVKSAPVKVNTRVVTAAGLHLR